MLKPCFVCFKDSKKPPHMNVLKVEAKFPLSSLLSSNIENFWNGTLFYLFHSLFHSHCFTDFILQFYYTILFIVQTKIVKTSSYTHTTLLFFSLLSSLLNEKSVVKWKSERFRESDTNLEIKVTALGALFSAIRRHSCRQRLKIAIIYRFMQNNTFVRNIKVVHYFLNNVHAFWLVKERPWIRHKILGWPIRSSEPFILERYLLLFWVLLPIG